MLRLCWSIGIARLQSGSQGSALSRKAVWLAGLVAVVVLTVPAVASAATCTDTWTGPSEGSWGTAADWSLGTVPASSEVACIGATATVNVTEGTNQAAVLVDEGGLVISGGSLELTSVSEASTTSSLTQHGGTLTGAGTLDVSGSFVWGGGTMSGSGSTVLDTGVSGTIETGYADLSERSFINHGTVAYTKGLFEMANGATITNTGTFMANSEWGAALFRGSPARFVNTGTFTKTEGKDTTLVEIEFENKGTVDAATGSLAFDGGGSSDSSAEWSASEGRFVGFTGGSFVLSGGSLHGVIGVSAGTVTVEGALSASTARLELSSGSLIVQSKPLTVSSLTMHGGTLAGAGTLDVSSSLLWGGGTMSGSGSTVLESGATSTIEADYEYLSERSLVNHGTFEYTKGLFEIEKGATITNTGTFLANSEWGTVLFRGKPARFVNTGTFAKTEGKGTGVVEIEFENLGRIAEETGKFTFTAPVVAESETQYGGGENPSGSPWQEHACSGEPVSCATGNYYETQTDLAVGGRGVGLNLTRAYNSQAGAASLSGIFGHGWTSSFSEHLAVEKATAVLYQADGSTVPFTESKAGTYSSPAWSQDSLSGSAKIGYSLVLADQVKYVFEGSTGRLQSVTDRNGNQTKLAYNKAGQLETVTDPSGRKITLTYDSEGLVEGAKDPMGHTVKYTYEGGNLASVTLPGETKPRWQYHYDGSHEITLMIDGRGGELSNEYDGSHQVTAQTDPAGRKLKFEYEPFHTKITNNSTGSVTDEHFTSSDEPFSITHGFGTGSATTETFTYNAAGEPLTVIDGNGHTTTYGYDSAGDRTSMTNSDKDETKWTYDSTHDVESITTPKGEKTTITRNPEGDAETISRPAPGGTAQTTTFHYNTNGEVTSLVDPLKHTWTYEYENNGDRTAVIDPENNKRTFGYNEDSYETSTVSPDGNVKGAEASQYTTKIERDAQNRATTVTDPLGHTIKYTYNGNGNLETLTDGEGHTSTYTYNGDNEPTKVKEPNSAVTEAEYDGAGRVTAQIDGNKHKTTYIRNILGEVTEVKDPLGRVKTMEYDAAGNLIAVTDAEGRTTKYAYDPANRLKEVVYSDGKTPTVKYESDADGNRTKMTDGTGATTYTYDILSRLAQTTNGAGETVGYDYDLDGNQIKLTYPAGNMLTRTYDNLGRLQTVTDWLKNTTTFAYDPNSNLITTTFPKGTSGQDKVAFNHDDQAMKITMTGSGLKVLASIEYTRNNGGQIKSTKTTGLPGSESVSDTYDANSRLEKSGGTPYEYDAADNPTKLGSNISVYDAADELKTSGGTTYGYDPLGERASATKATLTTTYGYDQAGNLIQVKQGKLTGLNDLYAYNGDGLRMTQTKGKTTSHLAWDVHEGLPLTLSDGQNIYIYGPTGLPIEAIQSKGAVLYYHHDQQGSTRMLTGATGTIEATSTYDPYGNLTGATGTVTTPLGYDGQYTNSDTGLIYLRARTYDPTTAQFLTVDPIVSVTQTPYTYSLDNPLSFYDPSGMFLGIPGTPSTSEVVSTVTGAIGSHAGAVLGGIGVGAACLAAPEVCVPLTLAATDLTVNSADVHAALNPSEAAELPYTVLQDLAATGISVLPTTDLGEDAYEAYFGSRGALEEAQLTALGTSAGIGVAFIPGFGPGTGSEEGFECS
jgi:RHS repeat-associated protein